MCPAGPKASIRDRSALASSASAVSRSSPGAAAGAVSTTAAGLPDSSGGFADGGAFDERRDFAAAASSRHTRRSSTSLRLYRRPWSAGPRLRDDPQRAPRARRDGPRLPLHCRTIGPTPHRFCRSTRPAARAATSFSRSLRAPADAVADTLWSERNADRASGLPLPSVFASRPEPARSAESLGFRLEASTRALGSKVAPRSVFSSSRRGGPQVP